MISTILTTSDAACLLDPYQPLQPSGDATVIEEVLRRLVQSPVREIIVVTGYQRRVVERLLERRPCRLVHDWSWYLGDNMTSIRAGLNVARPDSTAVLVCGADDLSVTPERISGLLDRMQADGPDKVYQVSAADTGAEQQTSDWVLIPKSFWPAFRQAPVRAGVAGFLNACAASLADFTL